MLTLENRRPRIAPGTTRVIGARREPGYLAELPVALTVSSALALLVAFVSTNLSPRFEHRAETIQQQFAILAGGPYPIENVLTQVGAYQNRVLFPLALRFVASLGPGSPGQWYLLLRLATALGAFLAAWFLLSRVARAQPRLAAVGLGLLAYELVFTFSQGWEHPTDFPDVALTSLWTWAAVAGRRWTTLGLALLAAFNRESATFVGVLWLALHGFAAGGALRLPELGFGVMLSAASYATVLGIRWLFGGPAGLAQNANLDDLWTTLPRFVEAITTFVKHPTPWSWPVLLLAMVALPSVWIWANRCSVSLRERRMLLASAAILVLSLPFSSLDEPRDFMTSIVLLVFVAVAAEASRSLPLELDVSGH